MSLLLVLLCAAAGDSPLVPLIREVTAEVEQLRGLHRKHDLKVEVLDDKLFADALREKAQQELTPAVVAAERARWKAFALAPAEADPKQILLGVLDEQVAGFYDPFTKQLIVRGEPPASANLGDGGLRLILAHEIEHALQDQNFGIEDPKSLPDDDVRLARSALLEGDAMAVMTAYGARRAHKPIKAAILGGAAMLHAVNTETMLRLSGKSPELLNAPAILREELVLPYSGGFALVAEAYRRGGFALVDRMFRKPPSSTHQVLHPDAYFAGEQPVPLAIPAAPPGTRVVASGRMGELATRIALEVCVEKDVARDFAPKWAGDAYTIVESPDHVLSLLWTSAWSGGAAPQVANLLDLEQPCWKDSASPAMPADAKIGASGSLVALARGKIDLAAAVARELTARAPQPTARPPLGNVPPPAPIARARIEDGQFVSDRLALRGKVPDGFTLDNVPAAELSIRKRDAGSASLSLVAEPLGGDALDAFFQATSGRVAAAQNAHLVFVSTATKKLAGAPAEERLWSLEGSRTRLRIDVAPVCGGKAALALVRVENADSVRDALEDFAASIHSTGRSPACAELE